MKNFLLIVFITIFLNSCVQTTAMFGPALTVAASGGNMYKAVLQYGANLVIKDKTGKSVTDHAFLYINKKKTKEIQLKDLLESHIISSRQKIFTK